MSCSCMLQHVWLGLPSLRDVLNHAFCIPYVSREGAPTKPRTTMSITIVSFVGAVYVLSICDKNPATDTRPGDPVCGRTRSRAVRLPRKHRCRCVTHKTPIKRAVRCSKTEADDGLRCGLSGAPPFSPFVLLPQSRNPPLSTSASQSRQRARSNVHAPATVMSRALGGRCVCLPPARRCRLA